MDQDVHAGDKQRREARAQDNAVGEIHQHEILGVSAAHQAADGESDSQDGGQADSQAVVQNAGDKTHEVGHANAHGAHPCCNREEKERREEG